MNWLRSINDAHDDQSFNDSVTIQGEFQVNGTHIRGFTVKAFVAAATLTGIHSASIAQTAEPQTNSDIVVEAPRPVPVPNPPSLPDTERNPYSGAPLILTTVQLPVLYNDLDLANPADAERLMTRIDRIGRDACTYLDRLYPLSSDTECLAKATGKAKTAAKAAIAAASENVPAATQP